MVFREITYQEWKHTYCKKLTPSVLCVYKHKCKDLKKLEKFLEKHMKAFSLLTLLKMDKAENTEIKREYECPKRVTLLLVVGGRQVAKMNGYSKKKMKKFMNNAMNQAGPLNGVVQNASGCFSFLSNNRELIQNMAKK